MPSVAFNGLFVPATNFSVSGFLDTVSNYGNAEFRLLPIALAAVLVLLFSSCRRSKPAPYKEDQGEVEEILTSLGAPKNGVPADEGSMVPSSGLVIGNPENPCPFENDWVSGICLPLHRATYDKDLNKTGNYRYGKYFLKKKRLWEMRFQFTFKKKPPPPRDTFFGVILEEYVPMNAATKKMMAILVAALKKAVGKQIYHTPGDDPARVTGPIEQPTFVMPLYAFDQFIVTPPGQKPPSLMDPAMPTYGKTRSGRVSEYKEEITKLEFQMGYTYTFNFWGISQWLDRLNWQVIMPLVGMRVSVNDFCGRPPVHVVIYSLKSDESEKGETRHLHHRKNYIFDLAFWSSISRPSKQVVLDLFKGVERLSAESLAQIDGQSGRAAKRNQNAERRVGFFSGVASCCTSRPST